MNVLTQTQDKLFNERETADLLGLTCRTLQAWRLQGRGIPFVRVSKRCVRYRYSDIQNWIEANTKTSTSME